MNKFKYLNSSNGSCQRSVIEVNDIWEYKYCVGNTKEMAVYCQGGSGCADNCLYSSFVHIVSHPAFELTIYGSL